MTDFIKNNPIKIRYLCSREDENILTTILLQGIDTPKGAYFEYQV